MKKLVLGSIFIANMLLANNHIITFSDLSVAVEKLYDNQVMLEKKIVGLEKTNKDLMSNYDEVKAKLDELSKNQNTLHTKQLKLELQLEEKNKTSIAISKEERQVSQIFDSVAPKVIVVYQRAFIRKEPIKQCGNIVRTAKFGEKLLYSEKVEDGNWYKLIDGSYISKLTVREYEENKKYKMMKSKSKAMECGK